MSQAYESRGQAQSPAHLLPTTGSCQVVWVPPSRGSPDKYLWRLWHAHAQNPSEKKVWKNEVEYGEEEEQHWAPPCGAEGPSGGSLGRADHVLDGWEEEVHLFEVVSGVP